MKPRAIAKKRKNTEALRFTKLILLTATVFIIATLL